MNLEKPNTLDRHETQETVPGFRMTAAPPPVKHKRHGWVWLVVLLLAALGLYYYRAYMNPGSAARERNDTVDGRAGRAAGPIPVVGVHVRKGDIGVYDPGLGSVVPIYTVTVKTNIAGYLTHVFYKEGQTVRKGDRLAQIDPRPYQVMLEQAQASLAKDLANLQNARVDLQRYQTLAPLKAIPEQLLATQEATVRQQQAVVQADQAQIDSAKLNLTYCRIVAPISGRVGLRLIDPGNYVTPNDATGLVVITQIEPISVIFPLAEDLLPRILERIRAGARLKVEAADRQNKKIADGWLATVDNQIDPTTGTVKFRAMFDNKDGSLFPNQFVNVRLLVEEKKGVTLIPTAAVQRNSQATYVYLVKPDSTVTVRTITVGTTEGDDSEVTSGLAPGDMVVMTGVDKLREGSPVRVHQPGERSMRGSS